MKKVILSYGLAVFLILGSSSSIFAETIDLPKSANEAMENVVEAFSEEIVIDSAGVDLVDENQILKNIDDSDVKALERAANSQGVSYEGGLTKEKVVEMFIEGIEQVDEKIEEGELKVLDGGTIVDSSDKNFYLQGGSTYSQTKWWGKRHYKSTSAASTWIYKLNSAGNANAGAAVIGGAVFGGVGAVPNGLTAAYCYQLANSASYWNDKNSRGIRADISWILIYSICNQ